MSRQRNKTVGRALRDNRAFRVCEFNFRSSAEIVLSKRDTRGKVAATIGVGGGNVKRRRMREERDGEA